MKRRTFILWKRFIFRMLVVLSFAGVLYMYFCTGTLSIRNYVIVGAPEGYEEELKTDISYASERKLFFLLPSNRIISYHDDEIRNAIMDMLPNTKEITIYPSGLHEITITLSQHIPVFSVSDTHAISSKGIVYKEIIPLDSFIRLEVSSSTRLSKNELVEMNEFATRISAVLFPVQSISVDEYDDVRFWNAHKKSSVIVPKHASIEDTWSNILSAIDTEPLKGKLKNEFSTFSYLDTRFGNKVFYKFTNPEEEAILPAHEELTPSATTTVR